LQKEIRVAVDAFGGDNAPSEIVKGAVQAGMADPAIRIILVGKEDVIQQELAQLDLKQVNVTIRHASEIVDMEDSASWSIKAKKDSSIAVAARLVKEKQAEACVSAGNTGAVTSASLLIMGRLPGLSRPAIGIHIPTAARSVFLLDAGANADCKPKNLAQFAGMAHIYLEKVSGIKDPSVSLLSIGQERGKGNELVREAYGLLEKCGLNFIGNAEGGDIPKGKSDIVVCDGFTGNVVLKLMEGTVHLLFSQMQSVFKSSISGKLAGVLLKPELRKLKRSLDYEEYGGTPLFGVNGVCIICHGSSKAKAIKNAVGVAAKTVREDVTGAIAAEVGKEAKD
jgi:glycerol-3-phosphate acyltransferase PlsX